MATPVPVDNDPFADTGAASAPQPTPVDHDPFAPDSRNWFDRMMGVRDIVNDPPTTREVLGFTPGGEGVLRPDAAQATKALADAATFGLSAKALGYLNPQPGAPGEAPSYAGGVAAQRAELEKWQKENPGRALEANVVGALLPGGAVAKGVGGVLKAAGVVPTLLGRMGLGAAGGAGFGAASEAGHTDSGDLADYAAAAKKGLTEGPTIAGITIPNYVIGGAAPVAGKMAGAMGEHIAPYFQPSAPGLSRGATAVLQGVAPADLEGRLAALGSQGTLADTGPGMLGVAQGVRTNAVGTPIQAAIDQPLINRAAGAPARLSSELDTNLGAPTSPVTLTQALKKARVSATSPMYEAAFRGEPLGPSPGNVRLFRGETPGGAPIAPGAPGTGGWFTTDPAKAASYGDVKYIDVPQREMGTNFAQGHNGADEWVTFDPQYRTNAKPFTSSPPQVDTTDVLATIGQRLNKAVGPEANALNAARKWMMDDVSGGGSIPVTDAEKLHRVKVGLQSMIDNGNESLGVPKGSVSMQQGALKDVVGKLNGALKDQVPGYADAAEKSAQYARLIENVEQGTGLLQTGPNAIWPQDLAARFNTMSPAEQMALKAGMRADIENRVGTQANDLAVLKRTLGGDLDWNRAKMGTVFGEQPTQNVADAIAREQTFANTNQAVRQNSETAARLAAAKNVEPSSGILGSPTAYGDIKGLIRSLGNKAYETIRGGYQGQKLAQLGDVITQPDSLYRQALVRALMAGRGASERAGQAISGAVSNPALISALMGGSAPPRQ